MMCVVYYRFSCPFSTLGSINNRRPLSSTDFPDGRTNTERERKIHAEAPSPPGLLSSPPPLLQPVSQYPPAERPHCRKDPAPRKSPKIAALLTVVWPMYRIL